MPDSSAALSSRRNRASFSSLLLSSLVSSSTCSTFSSSRFLSGSAFLSFLSLFFPRISTPSVGGSGSGVSPRHLRISATTACSSRADSAAALAFSFHTVATSPTSSSSGNMASKVRSLPWLSHSDHSTADSAPATCRLCVPRVASSVISSRTNRTQRWTASRASSPFFSSARSVPAHRHDEATESSATRLSQSSTPLKPAMSAAAAGTT
mmetsp:Transcript_5892/g.27259  ORF Transcript_5892/g.27259 Transcript_5892/m.27259 type:complete len:209 (-) Transcript_5892:22-648(-)